MTLEYAPSSPKITYDEAILYCFLCNHNGHKDWRLPDLHEYFNSCVSIGWYLNATVSNDYSCRSVTPVRTKHDS